MSGHHPWDQIEHKQRDDSSGPEGTVPQKRKKKRLPKVISAAEAQRVLEYVANDPAYTRDERVRNHAIVLVMYRAGLRVSEVVSLAVRDIERDGIIRVYDAKGGDGTSYFDPESVLPALDEWLAVRQRWLGSEYYKLDGALPLFLMNPPRKMNTRYVQRLVKRVRESLGIMLQVTPHTFRHTFATEMLEEGFTISEVQKSLRHAHLQTTAVYLSVRDDALRRKMSRRSQRGGNR